jgi:predicted RNA-binding protein YlqC (UPF0109 family)
MKTHSPSAATDAILSVVWRVAFVLLDPSRPFTVEATAEADSTTIMLRVAQKDIGKIIGKQGRIAHSIRVLITSMSVKAGQRHTLDIQAHAQSENHTS